MAGVVLRSGNGSGMCLNMSSATPSSVRSYTSSGVRAPHRHVIRSGELLPDPVTLTSLLTAVCAVAVLSAAGLKRGEPSQMLSCVVVVTFRLLSKSSWLWPWSLVGLCRSASLSACVLLSLLPCLRMCRLGGCLWWRCSHGGSRLSSTCTISSCLRSKVNVPSSERSLSCPITQQSISPYLGGTFLSK